MIHSLLYLKFAKNYRFYIWVINYLGFVSSEKLNAKHVSEKSFVVTEIKVQKRYITIVTISDFGFSNWKTSEKLNLFSNKK